MAKKKSAISLTSEQKEMLENALKKEKPVEFIETGNVGLDLALTDGKGLPMGSSTLLWAKPGCGKTTVVTDASRRLILKHKAKGEVFKVLFLAVEDSRELMESLGMGELMESKDFIYIPQRFCWRQIETFYDAVLGGYGPYEGVKLIIIDSINNVLSDQNIKNSAADGDYGTKARERSGFYGKYLPLCKEQGISSFFISQVRQKQGATQFEDPNKAAVSNVDLHNVDIILKCSSSLNATDATRIEEKTIFGTDKVDSKRIFKMDSKATDCKNRYIRGNAVELLFEKGKCVHNYYTVRKLLEGNGLLTSHAAGYWSFCPELCETFGLPTTKMRGVAKCNELIQEHIGDFINYLKEAGMYKVSLSATEVPFDEDEIEEDEGTEE